MSENGYSGKPVFEKLGLKSGMRSVVINPPEDYETILGVTHAFLESVDAVEFVHLFTKSRDEMHSVLTKWRTLIEPNGMLWVSWPKRSSKVPTDIDENIIREVCLPMGWVDVKVCAVSDVWSGLKLVIRKELR